MWTLIPVCLSVILTGVALWHLWQLDRALRQVQASQDRLHDRMTELLIKSDSLRFDVLHPVKEPEAPVYAFLPTEASEADMERHIRQSEDRSIGAQVRFSRQPSSSSGGTSSARPSTQRVPPSGRG